MMHRHQAWPLAIVAVTIATAGSLELGLARVARPTIVWNGSSSVTKGFYFIRVGPVNRGDLVLTELHPTIRRLAKRAAYLPDGVPASKFVAAVGGDEVCRKGWFIELNGRRIADALSDMANQLRDALGVEKLDAVADKGYYKGEEIVGCEDDGITVTLPKVATSNAKTRGRFDRSAFIYDAEQDVYVCPAGQQLTPRMTRREDGKIIHRYWTTVCRACPVKRHCTPSNERRIRRWEREDVMDRVQQRLEDNPDKMSVRRQTVEHPFGTIKAWKGATHFKMRTLTHVGTEIALHVLAYNMKRVISIIGAPELVKAIAVFLLWFAATVASKVAVCRPECRFRVT